MRQVQKQRDTFSVPVYETKMRFEGKKQHHVDKPIDELILSIRFQDKLLQMSFIKRYSATEQISFDNASVDEF